MSRATQSLVPPKSRLQRSATLSVRLKIIPELWPGFARRSTYEDIRMVFALLIFDTVWIAVMSCEAAGLKHFLYILARQTHHDQSFRRRIAVAAKPRRICAAGCFR